MNEVIRILSESTKKQLLALGDLKDIQEIRIAIAKPMAIIKNNEEILIKYRPTIEDVKIIMQKISNYSIYAYEEEIKQGYITIQGGHRIGLAGQCVIEKNSVKTIKNISSINIRISKQIIGCSNKLIGEMIKNNFILNTLIISPPKCGKTTLLRDIARNISDGYERIGLKGKRVVVIDERSEIAASYNGIPQMNLGIRTDVYDNCVKSEGMMMAIRSMAPEVLICDEIGTSKDMEALMMAYNSGVNIVCTLHGKNIEDIYNRPVFKEILDNKIINKVVLLSNKHGVGTIEKIYNI